MTRWLALLLLLPAVTLADPTTQRVRFETTAGDFVVELNAARAPLSVANFVRYVRSGHYDGTVFHRVIAGFVVQGGGYDTRYHERPIQAPIPTTSAG